MLEEGLLHRGQSVLACKLLCKFIWLERNNGIKREFKSFDEEVLWPLASRPFCNYDIDSFIGLESFFFFFFFSAKVEHHFLLGLDTLCLYILSFLSM